MPDGTEEQRGEPAAVKRGRDSPRGRLHLTALRDAAVSGVRWVIGARLVGEVAALASSVVLAHLVAPAEFGHAAVALVLPLLAVVLSFEGFGSVLVQRGDLEPEEAATAELMSMTFGLLASIVIFSTAPYWAAPAFGDETSDLIRLASPVFAIASVGVVSRARLQRRLDFRRISLIEVAAALMSYVVALTGALAGLGAEALVVGGITLVAGETAIMCAIEHPPRPGFDRGCAREIGSFGLAASVAALFWIARRNVDYIILSARLAPAQVGFYWRAFLLGAEYQEKLSGVLSRLAFPLFSRAGSFEDARVLRSRVVRMNVAIIFPLLTVLIVTAPILIPWLYGARWEPAVTPTQILAVGGMALAIMSGTEALVLAMGRPRTLLWLNASFLLVTGGSIFLATSHGLVAVCGAVAATQVLMVAVAQAGILRSVIGLTLEQLAADVIPALTSSALALALGFAVDSRLAIGSAPVEIAVLAGITAATYLLVLRFGFRAAWAEIVRTLKRVLPSFRRAGGAAEAQEAGA